MKPTVPRKKKVARRAHSKPEVPSLSNWDTTDADEVLKRQLRAREERFDIRIADKEYPVFSTFDIQSASGMGYQVEIRDLVSRQFACTCTDFRINGLGTCKHVEATLLQLKRRERAAFSAAARLGSPRIDVVPDAGGSCLRIERNHDKLPAGLSLYFDSAGLQKPEYDPAVVLQELAKSRSRKLRLSIEIAPWMESMRHREERLLLRRDYENGIRTGGHPEHVTLSPLFPYQREGMLHLAFGERALLADEMGLGKTIQAIAACALLQHLGKVRRVLVVAPASLKTEWEEQIRKFTNLSQQVVFGNRSARARLYTDPDPAFFTIVNYEQVVLDSLDINAHLKPDVVVLDEAQRIKNWSTKTAQAVKRLASRYAFVLTGTPIENRIDELYSIIDFLDPTILGPLFRFNRNFYQLDKKGRPFDYNNLYKLRELVSPLILRRRKAEVEKELPDRTDLNHFVPLTKAMREDYAAYERQVGDLVRKAEVRSLTAREQDLLMIMLNMMRMICDSPSLIKDHPCEDCPKLAEIVRVVEENLEDPDVKIIIFSEWTGMLEKVKKWADKVRIGYAWHTGSVPQKRRRAEILGFRDDPDCRLFLSTDSGGVGLNLQNASVVINCDLPWNPAKLEQRIARAWRKNQRRPVTVVNVIAENTIEHGMLDTLAQKRELSEGVLDGIGDISAIKLKKGREGIMKRLKQMLASIPPAGEEVKRVSRSTDPSVAFADRVRERLNDRLIACDETWIPGSDTPVILAVVNGPMELQRPAVEEIFRSHGWVGAPPVLQLMDTHTWESLQKLAAAGMISIHSRATRPLLHTESNSSEPEISREQQERISKLTEEMQKGMKAAQALFQAGLPDLALPHVRDAALAWTRVQAIRRAWPEPENWEAILQAPVHCLWPESCRNTLQSLSSAGKSEIETFLETMDSPPKAIA